jgi:preprotein translocase subunit YajC
VASLLFLPLLVILYFLMVRPQQQRLRAQRALVASIEVGDEVVTTAGMFGTITHLDADVATLEIAEGVEVRIARAAIGRLATDLSDAEAVAPADADADSPGSAVADDAGPADPHADTGDTVEGAA